ncbi:MAG: 50S ribosomal protein L28 [Lentisphaeria bacterium]|jgi:large subunit ribosomal protein L28|nr:50S ribosomal protein L28 [Lentisphaeria bacterium]
MSNVCEICGKKKIYGARIIRRGLAKKQGGIGMHVVKVSPRTFEPNIQSIRVKEANGSVVRKKVCTACIRGGKVTKAC